MATENILCCYFPTTVLFVDDNRKFLSRLQLELNTKKFIPSLYDNPFDAVEFLTNQYHSDPFTKRCLLRPEEALRDHRHIDVSVQSIHQEIYNPSRFNEISVIIVDYAMPGMNGLELCQQLKENCFKIILLTGEADDKLAIQAFNHGIIDRFIKKDDPNFVNVLNDCIDELQQDYFNELSEIVINSLTKNPEYPPSCLDDPIFIKFFRDFCKQNSFSEYYLTEASGSFLFLNQEGKASCLLVKDEDTMEAASFEAEVNDVDLPSSTLSALKSREKLLHCPPNTPFPRSASAWASCLYPAKKLSGKADYYYSYVTDPQLCLEDFSKITSFKAFLDRY